MKYTTDEVMQFIEEEDVKFIRLAFTDLYGQQRNIAVMPTELDRVFRFGAVIDGSAILGFERDVKSDLVLHPDTSTLTILPWRPDSGRVVRMFCDISYPDGTPFERDSRALLEKAVQVSLDRGVTFAFGSEMEFYLFKNDENGDPTYIPYDNASYMAIAPADKGENIRREVCLTLERMGIQPISSHHEEGPGQNEIDFLHGDPLTTADNTITFKSVVQTISGRSGLAANFDPKPIGDKPGSGMHINISVGGRNGQGKLDCVTAGILRRIREINFFLNPTDNSYERLGYFKAPRYVCWGTENRTALIRIPAAPEASKRIELRSPDCSCNPYLAYTLLIYAGLEGIEDGLELPEEADRNMALCGGSGCETLPASKKEAAELASSSEFVKRYIPEEILRALL